MIPEDRALTSLDALRPRQIWQDVTARYVQSERITMSVVEIPPGGLVPEHAHENEQVGLCLSGSVVFTVGEEKGELGPRGMWRIPSNVPHEVQAGPEGALVVECFSPVRGDWAGLPEAPDAPVRWPFEA